MEKNGKKIEIISFVLLIILILALGFTLYLRRNSITNVNKVLSNKYDEIKCVDDNCDYITVYSKDKNKIYVYDSYGGRISKYEKSNSNMLYSATPAYMLFKDVKDNGDIRNYVLTKSDGKKVYKTKNELVKLTDYLVEEKEENGSKIINNKGKELYANISKVKRYDGVTSIKVLDEEYLIDEKGERILSDYTIDKEVRDEDEETKYIILKDTSNAYYYFDVDTGKIKGDSFTSYDEINPDYSVSIYKKANGETIKYVLKANGEQKEDENDSQVKLVKKIKENLNEKYSLYEQSVYSNNQTKVLVDNKEENSFGTFDIKNKKYKKIYDYSGANGSSILLNFDSLDGNKYYQISCTESMCGAARVTVFDALNGEVMFEYVHGDNKISNYTGLEDGYKLIKYTADSTEGYSGKYVLYDKNNNIITSSTKLITVVDKKVTFGKEYDEESTIIYSAKLNKVLNTEDTLADIKTIDSTKIYRYSDDKYTYLVSETGKELFKVNNSKSNLIFTDKVIFNVSGKKVDIVDVKNNKVGNYKFEKGEKIVSEGETYLTYKSSIFVNNENSTYGKIVDYSGSKLKKLKKTTIYKVKQSSETKNIIIITTDGNKYGFYIAK